MSMPNLPGPSAFDSDYEAIEIDEILRQNDGYILALAREQVARRLVSLEVLDLEIDELAQRSRIKLWKTLQKRQISNVKAYLRCIVRSESIDMIRCHKPHFPLPVDEDGELFQGNALVSPGEGMQDPLYELEQREMAAEYITRVAEALRAFPTCQQRVMICSLKERLDDVPLLTKAFKKCDIHIECMRWPAKKKEKKNLKASISITRKKLRSLGI